MSRWVISPIKAQPLQTKNLVPNCRKLIEIEGIRVTKVFGRKFIDLIAASRFEGIYEAAPFLSLFPTEEFLFRAYFVLEIGTTRVFKAIEAFLSCATLYGTA